MKIHPQDGRSAFVAVRDHFHVDDVGWRIVIGGRRSRHSGVHGSGHVDLASGILHPAAFLALREIVESVTRIVVAVFQFSRFLESIVEMRIGGTFENGKQD